jgi:hypothetical protein
MKNSPRPLFLLHQILQLALCTWAGKVLLASGKPRFVHLTARWWSVTQENVFPLLQRPMAASFTPLQPTLGIAHGDLRLVCGCSAMETHFILLATNSFCDDVASRGSLELCSECCNWGQTIFTSYSTRRSRSVSLCGLPLCCWAVVGPRCFHYTKTALTVDQGSSNRAEIWWTDLLEWWHPMTVPRWKSLSSSVLLPMFVYGDSMAVCSILYSWIHYFEGVSTDFWTYSVYKAFINCSSLNETEPECLFSWV